MSATAPLLEAKNVRVRFAVKSGLRLPWRPPPAVDAVRDASFSLGVGETFALVGESGSGKSTLALAMAGLLPMAAGSIRFGGVEVTTKHAARQPYRRQMALVWQNPAGSLSPRLCVGALITEPYKIHRMKHREAKTECARLLKMVGLPGHFSTRYPHQLSGGQARRVGLARALALSPKLIIADEPTAGLDVSVQGEILNLLNRLQDDLGISIFVITHNLNIVRHIAHRTAIMYLGRLVEQGPTAEIFAHPRHPYTLALLSANPKPDPDARTSRIELKGETPSLLARPAGCEFHPRCPYAGPRCHHIPPPPSAPSAQHTLTCHYPR